MGLIELILTVCAATQPNMCEDRHFQFAFNGSLQQCAAGAQPYIAQWTVAWRWDYSPCHDIGPDAKIKLGPPLNGIHGRKHFRGV